MNGRGGWVWLSVGGFIYRIFYLSGLFVIVWVFVSLLGFVRDKVKWIFDIYICV